MSTATTVFLQNISNDILCVPGFPAFAIEEIREVSLEDSQILLANPFLVESSPVSSSETSDKKKSTAK